MSQLNETLNFFYEFCRNPLQIGSLCPSSKPLCEEMLNGVKWNQTMQVAELGAGNGALTRLILNRLNNQSQLDVFEINPNMLKKLERIEDDKLNIVPESAEHITEKYSLILSGLPFLSFSKEMQKKIMFSVRGSLCDESVFVLFQYTTLIEKTLADYFVWEKKRVYNNFPPAFVYYCRAL